MWVERSIRHKENICTFHCCPLSLKMYLKPSWYCILAVRSSQKAAKVREINKLKMWKKRTCDDVVVAAAGNGMAWKEVMMVC